MSPALHFGMNPIVSVSLILSCKHPQIPKVSEAPPTPYASENGVLKVDHPITAGPSDKSSTSNIHLPLKTAAFAQIEQYSLQAFATSPLAESLM